MRTLTGTSKHLGTAMALAVVVNTQNELSELPERIIREGLKAIRMNMTEADRPEVVIACDLLAIGASVRIPGVRIAGIAAERDDQPSLEVSVPCVVGLAGLLGSIETDNFAIVDGDEGVVYLDPDAGTVARYQEALSVEPAGRVFLESAHLPARTQDGRVVTVAAMVSSIAEAETAISQGADALVVCFRQLVNSEIKSGWAAALDPKIEILEVLTALAVGKPLYVVTGIRGFETRHYALKRIRPKDEPELLCEEEVADAVASGLAQVTVRPDAVARTKDLIRSLPEEKVEE